MAPLRCDLERRECRAVSRRLVAIGTAALLGRPTCGFATDIDTVSFGGHAFLSKFSDISRDFPHLSSALSGRSGEFDRALVQAGAQSAGGRTIPISFDELGTLRSGADANVLALAFDREVVTATRIGDTWKVLVELSFQALVFDFNTRMIRASYPAATQYIDAFDREPTQADVSSILQRLVFGSQTTGVIAGFWAAVAAAILPASGARTLRVTQVNLSEAATATMTSLGAPAGSLRDQLGYDFSKFLSANQRVSVLPYAPSQAIDGKMAARMANGSVYTLTVPPADYTITLTLDGLKKVQTAATAAGAAWVYGAFVTIRVVEPLSGRAFFDSQVKLGATRTIPATARGPSDDWPPFAEVIRQLFDELTRAVATADRKWASQHLVSANASLKPLKDLVDLCR